MIKLKFALRNETKTCYRFEHRQEDGIFLTLYLKKDLINKEGLDPKKGIVVTVEGEV